MDFVRQNLSQKYGKPDEREVVKSKGDRARPRSRDDRACPGECRAGRRLSAAIVSGRRRGRPAVPGWDVRPRRQHVLAASLGRPNGGPRRDRSCAPARRARPRLGLPARGPSSPVRTASSAPARSGAACARFWSGRGERDAVAMAVAVHLRPAIRSSPRHCQLTNVRTGAILRESDQPRPGSGRGGSRGSTGPAAGYTGCRDPLAGRSSARGPELAQI
jgi:hypothetical protein